MQKQEKIKGAVFRSIDSSILNNINVGIYRNTPGPKGKFIEVNAALIRMFGYTNKEEFLRKVKPADTYVHPRQRKEFSDRLLKKGFVKRQKLTLKRKDGSLAYAHVTAVAVKGAAGRIKWFDGIIEDVTEMELEQARFRLIFEHSPIAIWEEDFSSVGQLLQGLKRKGVTNVRKYLTDHPDEVIKAFRKIRILDVNKAALALYGAKSKNELISNFGRTVTKGALRVLIDEFTTLFKGGHFYEAEFKSRTLSGKLYDVVLRVSVPDGYEKSLSRVIVTIQNISEQKRLEAYLQKTAQQDSLTKLFNSRTITRRLDEELVRAKRYNKDLSCLMLDVDNFKTINDKFGHQKGDQIIKQVASIIRNSVRRSDIVGRYGGDEFLVILTETKPDNARVAAERIRSLLMALNFKTRQHTALNITISVGISGFPSANTVESKDLIALADKALYQAKESGRNRIVLAGA